VAPNRKSQNLLRSSAETIQDCSLVERESALELVIRRHGLTISITVPNDVQEWFVDVEDSHAGMKAHDWCDYGGYDSRTAEQQDRDMAEDLKSFVISVSTNPLRMRAADRKNANAVLEWQADGEWTRAVPANQHP